jgi:lipopolysaccharide export system protein LptA
MRVQFLSRILAFAVLLALPHAEAAEIVASGISVPFFNHAGKLTHRMLAKSGTKSGSLQKLHGVTIHYFAPHDPNTIVQKIEADEATWDDQKETLVGRGSIVVATVENRLTGEGFDFSLATSLLNIHRNFTMANQEVVLSSDRATIELIVDQAGEEVKVRDVKRCEATGNLHIVVQPTARKKYRFKEAFSDLAIYDGATQVVSLPNPIRTLQVDGGEGRFNTLTVNLRDEAKK